MTTTADLFNASTDCWLEIADRDLSDARQQASTLSPPGIVRQASFNHLTYALVRSWFSEELDESLNLWPYRAPNQTQAQWSVVNGTALRGGALNIVAIPSSGFSNDFYIPQEWVDIPAWVADYYIAVQLDIDDRVARIAGYCTHAEIKASGQYDPSDRTYRIATDRYCDDIYTLFMLRDAGLEGPTREKVAQLPELSPDRANNLLEQLVDPDLPFPRLARPFQLWGACLCDRHWLQQLYERRHSVASSLARNTVNLSAWVRRISEELSPDWQNVMQPSEFNLGFRDIDSLTKEKAVRVGGEDYILSVNVDPLDTGALRVTASIKAAGDDRDLPEDFSFYLLKHDGTVVCHSPSPTKSQCACTVTSAVNESEYTVLVD
ncbi:MAG: DUF1822 family protein [Cyanobacteria bacterium P01_F01_bin.3]